MFSAAKETIPRGRGRNYTPRWDEECESFCKDFTSAPDGAKFRRTASALLQKLDEETRRRWNEAVQSIDFIHSSRRACTIINNLAGHSRHLLASALFLQMPSLRSCYEMESTRREIARQLDS